jgi:hypothetical protein
MKVPFFLVVALCAFFATSPLQGQPIAPHLRASLDSALALLGMAVDDCTMPPDLLTTVRHREAFHDSIFVNPLANFHATSAVSASLVAPEWEQRRRMLERLLGQVGVRSLPHEYYEGGITSTDAASRLGIDPYAGSGFIGGAFLTQYIVPFVQAAEDVHRVSNTFVRSGVVVEMADSLWMTSKESETATLWQLAAEEDRMRDRATAFFENVHMEPYVPLFSHGLHLYGHLLETVRKSARAHDLLMDSVRTTIYSTPFGKIAVGGPGNDVYRGVFALIVDVGGDDVYLVDSLDKSQALETPLTVIVDLAGNDLYRGGNYSFASALGGVSIIIDATGDDVYAAGDFSLGSAVFGVGILHDMSGNDSYSSGQNTQGSGIFGLGAIVDDAGSDTYRAASQAQGFGATRGIGLCIDRSGNDIFLAASPFVDVLRYDSHNVTFSQGASLGHRPIAAGGIGMLVDGSGNDVYVSDIYGQGTAYWFGIGMLHDLSGDDRYQSYQYAQGSGVHFANGYLRDGAGDDVYSSHGVSQGCGHDVATGILLDDSGNDTYASESLSMGGGNANAISMLLDAEGNDSYSIFNESNSLGFSDFRRSYGMIGAFVDAGGDDRYPSAERNSRASVKSTYGVFFDAPSPGQTGAVASTAATPASASMELSSNIDSLLIQASAAPLRFQNIVQPARTALKAMGELAVNGLAAYLGTGMPRERLALEEVFPALYTTNREAVIALLSDSLYSSNPTVLSTTCTIIGKIRDTTFRSDLVSLAESRRWQERRLAAHTLGEINDTNSLPLLLSMIDDRHPYVAARAAFHAGRLCQNPLSLAPALTSPHAAVRLAASEGLAKGRLHPPEVLVDLLQRCPSEEQVVSALRILACCDTTIATSSALQSWLPQQSRRVRHAAYLLLASMPAHVRAEGVRIAALDPDDSLRGIPGPLPVPTMVNGTEPKAKNKRKKKRPASQ